MVAAAFLAAGFDMIVPLGATLENLCDLAAVAAAMVFIGLMEGA